jgi:hypothetical protein
VPNHGVPKIVARPTWVLRERHRPALFPGLVDPEPPPRSLEPVAAILDEVEAILRSGRHPYGLLDWLHSVSSLDWSRCAEVLRARGIVVDNEAVVMLNAAGGFWDQLDEFRRIYDNAVRLEQVEAAEGDWAAVEASELPAWLPGMHVPRMHRRD